jgi:CheY-like chemotaxis protein
MKKKLNCILLIDDNAADNRYHQIILQQLNAACSIQFAESGLEAINFLTRKDQPLPELIFLDINMPAMNGWEFLETYRNLKMPDKQCVVIVMLTTSLNPQDRKRAADFPEINGFEVKPLTTEMVEKIFEYSF